MSQLHLHTSVKPLEWDRHSFMVDLSKDDCSFFGQDFCLSQPRPVADFDGPAYPYLILPQQESLNFTTRCFRQLVDEFDFPRVLVGG